MPTEVIVVGTSLGGLSALRFVLKGLPANLRAVMAIVQHRGAWEGSLCALLASVSAVPISEPEDKERLAPGHAYLAPADYHLLIERGHFALSTGPRVCHARPSIDLLFESAAVAYGERVLGLVMTGANSDGALGARMIKDRGGVLLVQDPAEAESRIMPEAALRATEVDAVLPLSGIVAFLCTRCGG